MTSLAKDLLVTTLPVSFGVGFDRNARGCMENSERYIKH